MRFGPLPVRQGGAHIGQADPVQHLHGADDALGPPVVGVVVDGGHQVDTGLFHGIGKAVRCVKGEKGFGIAGFLTSQGRFHIADDIVRLLQQGFDAAVHGIKIITAVRLSAAVEHGGFAHNIAQDGDLHGVSSQ